MVINIIIKVINIIIIKVINIIIIKVINIIIKVINIDLATKLETSMNLHWIFITKLYKNC